MNRDGTLPTTPIIRHRLADRVLHWVMAAATLALLGTGLLPILGLKFPWVTAHWIAGLVLTAAALGHIARVLGRKARQSMWIGARDVRIALAAGRPGKYSLAQKLMHHAVTVFVLITIATGLPMLAKTDSFLWRRNPYMLGEGTWGVIYVLHDLATLFLISLVMLHVYFALRPEKLFYTRSMILGFITGDEYRDHHDRELWPAGDKTGDGTS